MERTQDDVPSPQEDGSGLDGDKAIEQMQKSRYLVMMETNGFGLEIIKTIKTKLFCKVIEYETFSGVSDYGEYE